MQAAMMAGEGRGVRQGQKGRLGGGQETDFCWQWAKGCERRILLLCHLVPSRWAQGQGSGDYPGARQPTPLQAALPRSKARQRWGRAGPAAGVGGWLWVHAGAAGGWIRGTHAPRGTHMCAHMHVPGSRGGDTSMSGCGCLWVHAPHAQLSPAQLAVTAVGLLSFYSLTSFFFSKPGI